ncbi:MAG: right-handed parallel beta-helix repeat-containing protein [Desulfobacteraceae bacterium]|nr:right-handed parallel beta-helix repeat-containing protein [Desulfobacteraceae bacterium]
MKLKAFFCFLLAVFLFTLPVSGWSTTRNVPSPYTTIQSAINAAVAGDTVIVGPGTYHEDIVLKSGVDVLGGGFETTEIKGSGPNDAVYASNVDNARLDGFTVYGSINSSRAGIRINGGSLTISNNRITNNWRGLMVYGNSSAIIKNNIFAINGNSSDAIHDYGILCLHATPLITNNVISTTRGSGIYIGWTDSSGAQVINNTIINNSSDGIWCYRSSPIIKNNIITGNVYGIAASHGSAAPVISYNNVWGNVDDYNSQSTGTAAPGPGDISEDPQLVLPSGNFDRGYFLGENSPCIDAGDPNAIYNDVDGTRNDMGAYGGMDGSFNYGYPPIANGFVFTTVGNVPISEITQTGYDQIGLANVSDGAASDLHIPKYVDAPFGSSLWISGLFGSNDTNIQYYQILAGKWDTGNPPDPGDYAPLEDLLTKVLYTINPDGTVSSQRISIGPLPNPANLKGLYMRTETGYWAHRDLKVVWNTSGIPNGRYNLKVKAYTSSYEDATPKFVQTITLHVNNSPVEANIHEVRYDNGTPITECSIIELMDPLENLQFEITAKHPEGFLRRYELSALYGTNQDGGDVVKDQYVNYNDGSPPIWTGVDHVSFNSEDAPSGQLDPWNACAYQFHLQVWGRTTNGFNYIRYDHFNDHYYLLLNPAGMCKGDINKDGNVDGSDLIIMVDEFGRTDCP